MKGFALCDSWGWSRSLSGRPSGINRDDNEPGYFAYQPLSP
jgi:hypothetical protein